MAKDFFSAKERKASLKQELVTVKTLENSLTCLSFYL